jgi:hypothetical protein
MPYFIILPLYALLLLTLIGLGGVFLFVQKLRYYAPFVFAAALGSFLGLILANVILIVCAIFLLKLPVPKSVQTVQGVFTGITLFIGPFIASTVGVLLGMFAGAGMMWRLKRK